MGKSKENIRNFEILKGSILKVPRSIKKKKIIKN